MNEAAQIPLALDAPAERRCSTCGLMKPVSEFAFRSIVLGTRQSNCRGCHANLRRAHYEANRDGYIKREAARVKKKSLANRLKIIEYLLDHACVDCGERDPVLLDFDHRDPHTKRYTVGLMVSRSWSTVAKEIAKCDVRCVNCHLKRT